VWDWCRIGGTRAQVLWNRAHLAWNPTPAEPTPAPAAITPAREDAQVVAVPNAARGATPVGTPRAPVRVMVKPTPTTPTPAPAASAATDPAPLAATDPARPARLPTAPVKQGTAYDWTGLP